MISAILLAAGESKRMKDENKLIKEINGLPLIKHAVKNILGSAIDELIIVLGHEKEVIEKFIDKDKKIKLVFNKNFYNGMASSIKVGLDHLSRNTQVFFICLGDMPEVKPNIYNKLVENKNNNKIVVPIYNNMQGNPVLFPISMKKEIMQLDGDVGAKEILSKNQDKILNLKINDEGIIKNYNTLDSFNI